MKLNLRETNNILTIYYCEIKPFHTYFTFNYNLSYYYRSETKSFLSVLGKYILEFGNPELLFAFAVNNNHRFQCYEKFRASQVQFFFESVLYTNNYSDQESRNFYNDTDHFDRIKYVLRLHQKRPMMMIKYTIAEIIKEIVFKKINNFFNSFN